VPDPNLAHCGGTHVPPPRFPRRECAMPDRNETRLAILLGPCDGRVFRPSAVACVAAHELSSLGKGPWQRHLACCVVSLVVVNVPSLLVPRWEWLTSCGVAEINPQSC
jgi:hypothetical protein